LPITLVISLTVVYVIVRLVGSIAARLLGLRPPWWRTLIAVYLGATAGSAFAVGIGAPRLSGVGAPLVFFGSTLVASMLATVLLELIVLSLSPAAAQQRGVAVPNPVRAVRHAFARWARYLQITGIVARYGLTPYLTGQRASAGTGAGAAEDISASRRLWSRISRALAEAGGAFVKLGQVLSTRADLLPPDAIAELAGLQDKVPPAPQDAIAALLARELGGAPDTVFASFDATPLAAASIAQAHGAQLATGEHVIVKVQRPGIREPVERDLDILLRMARGLEARAAWARAFGAGDLAAGFAASLREELDFRVEARNIGAVAASLDPAPHNGAAGAQVNTRTSDDVRIPRVFPQHSTSRVLVLEWLDGISARDAGPLIAELGLSRPALSRALLRCFLRQILREGTFHADPHPGNILVLRDGQLALIDFGSVGRLDPLQQTAIKRLLVAMGRHDAALLSDALLDLAQVRTGSGRVDEERLERSLAQLMAQRLGPGMSPGPELFADLFAVLLDFGLAFPPVVGGVFRALVTLQGTLALLDPEFHLVDEARALGGEWMQESFGPTSLRKAATDELLALLPLLQRLPRRLDRITAALERGQLSGNVRLLSDDRDVRVVSRLMSRGILAFLGVGLSISSVLLLGLHGGPILTPALTVYQLFGYCGLFVSAVLILRVIVAIARERSG
jgi:ubiquinone biosynthesis protein